MQITEDAYAAGIVDGEGSISCGINGYLFLAVGMLERTIPDWLYTRYGGAIMTCKNKTTRTGTSHQWQTNGAACREPLIRMLPFLILKREAAELGLALIETLRPRSNRSSLHPDELLVKAELVGRLRALTSGDHKTRGKLEVR